jgi:phosphate transport system substrate-binding protein
MDVLTKNLRIQPTLLLLITVLLLMAGVCKNKHTAVRSIPTDTDTKGHINISVDETFKPVIDEQIKVFENAYPEAHITVSYKPEADCFRDLDSASTRMIIVTRPPDSLEKAYYLDKLQYNLTYGLLATDAIAIVVNKNNPDSVFSREDLRKILLGTYPQKYRAIFDGLKATSTVRYAIDSILKGKMFDTAVVRAVDNSQGVLNYVASNEMAIGFVGVSWIGNPDDVEQQKMREKVNIALIKCENCLEDEKDICLKPTQRYILSRQYPLTRGLYYIAKENYPGLGRGFAEFMWQDRGQLIFKRAYLAPEHIPFIIRKTTINR